MIDDKQNKFIGDLNSRKKKVRKTFTKQIVANLIVELCRVFNHKVQTDMSFWDLAKL